MTPTLRLASGHDLPSLCQLEQVALSGDRFSRRQFHHLLYRAHALTLVAEGDARRLLGYGTLLLRRNSTQARLYSFCVHPGARRHGVGRGMLQWLTSAAMARGCDRLVLEVRVDNPVALGLYRSEGFLPNAWLTDYYEDGCAAWRMTKELSASPGG
ncbi:GNAT family N-acetyltransferase [Halomonas caseinilytica]|uniref:GNAT family N-acetyltransferase n=1 Tax=Halomonas caseinilytica TaxID=438744 RepID=UPI0008488F93|nr:GNAT family N-acetyltransferase [Halomonas caseinilytica]